MTNREKYAEQILDIVCAGKHFAMDKNKNIIDCEEIECNECEFVRNDSWCEKNIKKWCESEYVEKPKISESDRRFLDYLPDGYKYMARDKRGTLFAYKSKPRKNNACCSWFCDMREIIIFKEYKISFSMIKWKDEEPWLIEDLKKLEGNRF